MVEGALKACIAKLTREHDFPPNEQKIREIYTHNLGKLLKSAGLEREIEKQMKADAQFAGYWKNVEDWSEQKRYDKNISYSEVEEIIRAIIDKSKGILLWLKNHW